MNKKKKSLKQGEANSTKSSLKVPKAKDNSAFPQIDKSKLNRINIKSFITKSFSFCFFYTSLFYFLSESLNFKNITY